MRTICLLVVHFFFFLEDADELLSNATVGECDVRGALGDKLWYSGLTPGFEFFLESKLRSTTKCF